MTNRKCLIPVALLLPLMLIVRASAQDANPVLEPQTMVLIKIDMNQVNVDLIQKWMLDLIAGTNLPDADQKQMTDIMKQSFAQMGKLCQDLVASGGNTVYIAFGMQDMQYGPSIYVPVDPATGVPEAVAAVLYSGRMDGPRGPDLATVRAPSQRVITPLGQGIFAGPLATYQRLQANKIPALQLSLALNSAPPGAAQAVFIPSPELLATLEAQMPNIPAPVDLPMTTLTHGITSASAGLQLPPGPSARLVIQATDAAIAIQLKALGDRLLPVGSAMMQAQAPTLDAKSLAEAVVPVVEGDKITLTFDEAKLKKLVGGPMILSLQQARESATRVQSASNMHQMIVSIINHAQQNQGKLPASMDEIKRLLGPNADRIMSNPRAINAEPAYIYVNPGGTLQQAPRNKPLFYENPAALPPNTTMINAAYPDGSVRAIAPAQLQQILNAPPAPQPNPPPTTR